MDSNLYGAFPVKRSFLVVARDGPMPDDDDEIITRSLDRTADRPGIPWEIKGPIPLNVPYEPDGPSVKLAEPTRRPADPEFVALREHYDKWRRDHPEWVGKGRCP